VSLDGELDRVLAALERGGAAPPEPVPAATIAAFEALVAPLELPAELRRFWERVNPGSLFVAPFPDAAEGMSATEFAEVTLSWWAYRRQLDDRGPIPETLLCIAQLVDRFRFVELAGAHGSGGIIYGWERAGGVFEPQFASIVDWLARVADELEDGPFRTLGDPGGAMLYIDPDRYAERTGGPGEAPLEAWRKQSGLFDGKRRPKPADRSISELLWDSVDRRVEATVSGALQRRLWSDSGSRVLICDATGLLHAHCDPSPQTEWLLGRYERFEVDLVAGPNLDHRLVGRGRAPADRALDALPPQARVTALRPYVFE